MSFERIRKQAIAAAATATIAGGLAETATASPQPLPGNGPKVCEGYTNGTDPTVNIHEVGSISPKPAQPEASAPDPTTSEPFSPNPAPVVGEYTKEDTPLDDPNKDDRYSTFAQCNGPEVVETTCNTLGAYKVQEIAVDSFKDDGNSYMAYVCIGTETGGYPPLGDDIIYGPQPPVDCPDGSEALSAPQPNVSTKSVSGSNENPSTSVSTSYYCANPDYSVDELQSDHILSSNVSPRFIQKCVHQSLAKGTWSVSRLSGRPYQLLVEHGQAISTKEIPSEPNGYTCDDFVTEKQTKVVPLLGTNIGSSKLRNNSFGLNIFDEQADFDAVIEAGRRYTCAGTTTDNKVRRFGAKVTMSVVVDPEGKRPKKQSRTFTVLAPKRMPVNGKLKPNGC